MRDNLLQNIFLFGTFFEKLYFLLSILDIVTRSVHLSYHMNSCPVSLIVIIGILAERGITY